MNPIHNKHLTELTRITLICLCCMSSPNILLAEQTPPVSEPPRAKVEAKVEVSPTKQAEHKPLKGTVFFFNGDSISGKISKLGKDSVSITSPDLLEPVTFTTAKVLNLSLEDQRSETEDAEPNKDLTTLFINHRNNQKGLYGVIKGAFSNIGDKYVTLETSYAGEIKVLKKFITKMMVDSKKGYLYTGPKSLENWHNNSIKQAWEYTNNALISKHKAGNLAQDIGIPDEASISFDLSWKDDENITLYLFSSNHEKNDPKNRYQLNINRGKCSLLKYTNGSQDSSIISALEQKQGQIRLLAPDQQKKSTQKQLHAHYNIYMSKLKGEFHVYRNGIKIEKFADKKPTPELFGTALHIISSKKTPIRVRNLTMSKWSGHIPSNADTKAFAKIKGEGERILFKNGDIVLGKIGTVRDGFIQIETLHTPLNIPVLRMRTIDLTTNQNKEEPLMYAGDIKCWFRDKGWIILKLIEIEGNVLTAYHQALGENKFDLHAFKRIDLHIYNKTANLTRKSDNW